MRCIQCGRDAADDATFCPHCGERLTAAAPKLPARGSEVPPTDPAEKLRPAGNVASDKHPPEAELWNDTYSPKALFGPFIAIDAIVTAALIGVLLFWNTGAGWLALGLGVLILYGGLALTLLYQRLSVRYRLTTFRFFHERGIFSRVTERIEAIDIDDVTVQQGLIERMLGVGTIVISSSDRTHPQLKLPGIDRAKEIADLIDATRRAERQRRGLHIEAI